MYANSLWRKHTRSASQQLIRALAPGVLDKGVSLRHQVVSWQASCCIEAPYATLCALLQAALDLRGHFVAPLFRKWVLSGFLTLRARSSSFCTGLLNSSTRSWRLGVSACCGVGNLERRGCSTPASTLGRQLGSGAAYIGASFPAQVLPWFWTSVLRLPPSLGLVVHGGAKSAKRAMLERCFRAVGLATHALRHN